MNYKLAVDSWDFEEFEAINEVLKSNKFTMGQKVAETERKFANFFGSKYCVMVNSGSSANLISIASLVLSGRLNKGDEVIVPAISWSTTYSPLQQYGLKLKFVDVDLETLNFDISKLKSSIGSKTKMIFVVNLLGNNNNFFEIEKICEENELFFIEDNCESMGSSFNGKYSGTFGLIGTFSSFYSHHISSMEGGYCLTDDYEIYNIMRSVRAHGWTRDIDVKVLKDLKKKSGFYDSFDFILPGYNVRPLEIEAAITSVQLDKLNRIIKSRQENADYFLNKLNDVDYFFTQKPVGESSWFGFAVILKNQHKHLRDSLANYLNEKNIDTRPIVTGNFARHDVIKYYDYELHDTLPNANYIHDSAMFIGNSGASLINEINYFYDTLKDFPGFSNEKK